MNSGSVKLADNGSVRHIGMKQIGDEMLNASLASLPVKRLRRRMPRIEEMYAYIAHEKGDPNDEGLTAMMIPGMGSAPMVGADEARMASIKPIAQELANTTGQTVTLVKFSVRTDLETIEPEKGCPHGIPLHLRGKANACLAGGPKTEDYPGGQFCSYYESGEYKEESPGLSVLQPGKCKLESE